MTLAVWAQTLILAFTAYWILRYTRATEQYTAETVKLRAETVRQSKLSLRPVVLPEFIDQDVLGNFRLKNCGNGCAINIQVMPVGTMRFAGGNAVGGFGVIETRFDAIEYLASGETKNVEGSIYSDGQPLGQGVLDDWFHPRLPGGDETIEIRFSDVEGGRYQLRLQIVAGEDLARLPRTVRLGQIEDVAV